MKTFSALLDLCAGKSPVTGEFPAQRPVTRSFGVFFDLRLNNRLSKQSWGWWFETPSCPLWRHRNAKIIKKMNITYGHNTHAWCVCAYACVCARDKSVVTHCFSSIPVRTLNISRCFYWISVHLYKSYRALLGLANIWISFAYKSMQYQGWF